MNVSLLKSAPLPIDLSGPFSSALILRRADLRSPAQWYRFLVSPFAMKGLIGLLGSLLCLFAVVPSFEITLISSFICPLILLSTSLFGTVFSLLINGDSALSFGPSNGLFGILGFALGYLILNTKRLYRVGFPLAELSLHLLISSLIFLFFLPNSGGSWGSFFGFTSGLFIGLLFAGKYDGSHEDDSLHRSNCRLVGGLFLIVMLATAAIMLSLNA